MNRHVRVSRLFRPGPVTLAALAVAGIVAATAGVAYATRSTGGPVAPSTTHVGYATHVSIGTRGLTFGNIPASAVRPDGIDWAKVPDYVGVVKDGRVVGYISRATYERLLEPQPGPARIENASTPVYDESLRLVGHVYPVVGFVPLGSPAPSQEEMTPTTVAAG